MAKHFGTHQLKILTEPLCWSYITVVCNSKLELKCSKKYKFLVFRSNFLTHDCLLTKDGNLQKIAFLRSLLAYFSKDFPLTLTFYCHKGVKNIVKRALKSDTLHGRDVYLLPNCQKSTEK